VAEAEGFEPPVPLGTLAFKVVDPAISDDHPCQSPRTVETWVVVMLSEWLVLWWPRAWVGMLGLPAFPA
jgi:hypothetical protein